MQVDGVGEVPLHDTGGIPVVWIDGRGIAQDPNWGGTNVYGPGDILDDDQGNMYQIGADYHIRPFGTPAPRGGQAASPVGGAPPAAAPPAQNVFNFGDAATKALIANSGAAGGNTANTANKTGGSGGSSTGNRTGTGSGSGTGAIGLQGDPKKFSHEVADWLNRSDFIQGVPNGFIAAGGAGVLLLMRGRKRR